MQEHEFLEEHFHRARRFFLRAGALGVAAALPANSLLARLNQPQTKPEKHVKPDKAGAFAEPYFTPAEDFRDVSR